jgi:hypothetical protein
MKAENKKNILFVLYILTVLVLAVIYFSVPERREFIAFNMKWWKELLHFPGILSHIRLVL